MTEEKQEEEKEQKVKRNQIIIIFDLFSISITFIYDILYFMILQIKRYTYIYIIYI